MQITPTSLNGLTKRFRIIYDAAYQAGTPFYPQFTLRVPSDADKEVYAWLGAVPGMRELLGEIVIQNLATHGWTITNKEWESTIGVKQSDIENDFLGRYSAMFASMGESAVQFPDELAANQLVAGFTTPCYTGSNFFAAAHKRTAKDVGFGNTTTKKLSPANFEIARANIKSRKNAASRPMNLGKKLQLIVSPKNEALGRQILQADFIQQAAMNKAGTENVGGVAITNVNKGTAELIVWPQLSIAEDAWFLLETGFVMRPLIFQVNLETKLVAANQPNDFNVITKHEFLYQAYGRFNVGYGLPEFAYGSDGSAAA